MFNYHNRQFIFRQSNGELWNFSCDLRQNLCYSTLTKRGVWSNPVVLHKNTYKYFYADMDQEEQFHLLFQDNDGNIHYSRLDRESIKTVSVLNSKTPSAYNKQFFIAPFKNNVYIFYVLQHENSFILACQVLSNGKISNPKVVDYVSGSSLPCIILYDKAQNLYAFYQSYDGKYLQLGYKKLNAMQKSWSEFTPVTKYAGNCEYPHAIIDDSGIIHLCYQRRAPKLFEMVYQQKAPDKNLWTPEVIVHSSVHSFENASIVQANGSIVVYWVREEIIYYNTGAQTGNIWSKPSRLNFPASRPLQCLCYKSNSPRDRADRGDGSPDRGDGSQLPPAIYPGSFSGGLKLAFNPMGNIGDNIGDSSQIYAVDLNKNNAAGSDIKGLVLDTFKQLQGDVDEIKEGWKAIRDELSKLTNAYGQLNRELGKYSIRLKMLESQPGQSKKPAGRRDTVNAEVREIKEYDAAQEAKGVGEPEDLKKPKDTVTTLESKDTAAVVESKDSIVVNENKATQKSSPSLEPDKLKEWQEWKEPKEWQESDE